MLQGRADTELRSCKYAVAAWICYALRGQICYAAEQQHFARPCHTQAGRLFPSSNYAFFPLCGNSYGLIAGCQHAAVSCRKSRNNQKPNWRWSDRCHLGWASWAKSISWSKVGREWKARRTVGNPRVQQYSKTERDLYILRCPMSMKQENPTRQIGKKSLLNCCSFGVWGWKWCKIWQTLDLKPDGSRWRQ